MSWMLKLFETYEANRDRIGNANERIPLVPVMHMLQAAHVEVCIDKDGTFLRAAIVPYSDAQTIIPCTEASLGRSGKMPASHPLCDTLQYVAGDFRRHGGAVTSGFAKDAERPFIDYCDALRKWCESPFAVPQIAAVNNYVQKACLITDLSREGILFLADGVFLAKWPLRQEKQGVFRVLRDQTDVLVRWAVEIPGKSSSKLHTDPEVWESWTKYCCSDMEKEAARSVCAVTGEQAIPAAMHPKKVVSGAANAKLISSDDKTGYTYRGRFKDASQACTIGLTVTHKAHSALRWLIERQAYQNKSQAVVAWAISGKKIPDPFASSESLLADADAQLATQDATDAHLPTGVGDVGQAFSLRLAKMIAGYKADLGPTEAIVVMGLDSATPGRLAVTFYRELTGSEFLERVTNWHTNLAWPRVAAAMQFVGAPSPRAIAEAAYGLRIDDKLARATVERILPCVIDGRPLPRDLMEAAVRRAAKRASIGASEWEQVLWIACALCRGYHKERSYCMALETDRRTRDYLYGRLLAIAEHLEARALYVAGENRDTTAAKLMQRFADRPYSTWLTIEKSLVPYKTRLQSKRPRFLNWATGLMDEVHGLFSSVQEYADNRPLTGEYLLGYHCQRSILRQGAVGIAGEEYQDNSEE
jgi:CRISPR-associated protein Csd1